MTCMHDAPSASRKIHRITTENSSPFSLRFRFIIAIHLPHRPHLSLILCSAPSTMTAFITPIPLSLHHTHRATTALNRPQPLPRRRVHLRIPNLTPRAALSPSEAPSHALPQTAADIPSEWHVAGVYAVYSNSDEPQYTAATTDIASAVAEHMAHIAPEQRASIKFTTCATPLASILRQTATTWLNSFPTPPPGNQTTGGPWRSTGPDLSFLPNTQSDVAAVHAEIEALVKSYPVVLFMKGKRDVPRCGFSAGVVEALKSEIGDAFVCVDVLDRIRNEGCRDGIKSFTGWPTLPQLYVGGEFVGGADIIHEMQGSGELKATLEKVLAEAF